MYIYQSHALHIYDDLALQLLKNVISKSIHRPLKNYPYVNISKNIQQTLPFPYFNRKGIKYNLLLGMMDTEDIIQDRRKIFTIIQHPIIHTYGLFDFVKANSTNYKTKEKAEEWSCISSYDVPTLEKFIDDFIKNQGRIVLENGYSVYGGYTRISKLHPNMHFIGCIEQIDFAIDFIEDTFNFELDLSKPEWDTEDYIEQHFPSIRSDYRRNDLTHLLKEDILRWEKVYRT